MTSGHRASTLRPVEPLLLYADGASQGNPGHAGAGVVILDAAGTELERKPFYLGNYYTNNQAEYLAVLRGLELALNHCRGDVTVYSDSQLVVNQLAFVWRVHNPNMLDMLKKVTETQRLFKKVDYVHVPSGNKWIKIADSLSHYAINMRGNP